MPHEPSGPSLGHEYSVKKTISGGAVRAERGGLIRFEVACGEFVPAGKVIARIRDVFGNELEAIPMPADGYVMTFPAQSWIGNQAVATGDLVADIFA